MSYENLELKYFKVPFNVTETKIIKEDNGDEFFIFKGYGSTFTNIDRQKDSMVKGCFEDSLKEITPVCLWQHKMYEPVGVFPVIYEDQKGLYLEAKLPLSDDFVKGRVVPQIKIGSVRTLSIGFTIVMDEYDRETGVTYIKKVKLYEVSLVSIPANPMATIDEFKNLDSEIESLETIRDVEHLFKKIGFSNKKSVIIISKLKNIVRDELNNQCDIDEEMVNLINGIKELKMED